MENFKHLLDSRAALVERTLQQLLSKQAIGAEVDRPEKLIKAMRHSSLDGGKRLRPFLVMECAALFGIAPENSVFAATALECIHCYSLVHDDLPSMDDDDLRRGKPTTHKAFDEATAILAGDALLTLAFDVLAREQTHPDAAIRIELVQLFAQNAGIGGMVGGQVLDLEAETKSLDETEIYKLQSMKTGALLRCACETGAILGNANAVQRNSLLQFGKQIGIAFQLADDLLDVTSNTEAMGKKTGKDADKGKETLVDLYGLERARKLADKLLEEAINALAPLGERVEVLSDAARFVVTRES